MSTSVEQPRQVGGVDLVPLEELIGRTPGAHPISKVDELRARVAWIRMLPHGRVAVSCAVVRGLVRLTRGGPPWSADEAAAAAEPSDLR